MYVSLMLASKTQTCLPNRAVSLRFFCSQALRRDTSKGTLPLSKYAISSQLDILVYVKGTSTNLLQNAAKKVNGVKHTSTRFVKTKFYLHFLSFCFG